MQVTESGGLGSRPKTWTLWLATGRSLWTAESQGRVDGKHDILVQLLKMFVKNIIHKILNLEMENSSQIHGAILRQ